MEEAILRLLSRRDYSPSDFNQLRPRLGLASSDEPALKEALAALEQNGQIIRTKGNRYIQSREADLVAGILRVNRQGKGFLDPDDPKAPEIVVPESATSTALNGDRVLVRRDIARGRPLPGRQEPTGAVVRILERKRSRIVGTLRRSRQFLFVIPDDPRIPHDIYVTPARPAGRPANVGDKVVVELKAWESRHTNPEGEIVEVLGPPENEGVDMLSVLRQYNLPGHFPKRALHEAATVAKTHPLGEPPPEAWRGRVDCRGHCVVTIDPDDAKDFDDAICLERHARDQWKLWVHIADVAHYVQPGSALDEEALQRGNSTYLVDRVIPMLPEALSNGLCSLNPAVNRLTKCVEFLLSHEGRVLAAKYYPAVIRSRRRLTYRDALAILRRPPARDPVEEMLHQAHALAQRIRRARFQAGSLALDFPETKIRLDEKGRILRIEKIENDVSHQLIEEFMLLANEAVAARLMSLRQPAVYRVHEPPEEARLAEYREDVVSHKIPCGDLSRRPEVQKLLARLGSLPIGPALKIGFLKSLMRARYAVEPLGHYGLNKAKYTHFTSPIRRYADLVVHRALFDKPKLSPHALASVAKRLSETERNSADAERDSKDVKLFAYLSGQLKSGRAENYPALVIDVRNFGFFVDVPALGMSGLVHLSSVEDDFYIFDAARDQLVGRRTRRVIRLGDQITVQVSKVDTFKKQVDFRLTRPLPKARPIHGGPEKTRHSPKIRQEASPENARERGLRRPAVSPAPPPAKPRSQDTP
jgi:ribonuclease R